MSEEMRECPFLHGTDERPPSRMIQPDLEVRVGEGKFWGQCNRCGATGPWADTEAAAIAAWNKRAGCASCRDEAIGAALAVEQKCYDQAQELAALRKLCGEVKVAEESLVSAMLFGPVESGMVSDHQRRLSAALNAYDETIKEAEGE